MSFLVITPRRRLHKKYKLQIRSGDDKKIIIRCIVQKSRPSLNVKVKGQGHPGPRLAMPTPPGVYECYALAANSMQQQQTAPFRGCQGVAQLCHFQFYASGKISACCLVRASD